MMLSFRLVEVVEPNPSGNGSVATSGMVTTYSYSTLGNLVEITQGAQTRSFKYDSLGRLTAQKLAETSATLNDAGTYVGSGTWSDVFTYDDRSNLTSRTDARGVKTVYSYNSDPLNRLQSVSWDTSGFGDTTNPILAAATVTYQYRQKASPSDLKDVTQLTDVTAAGVSTESYAYDTEGRVSSKTLTLTSRSSYPFVTDYIYDSLDRAKDMLYPAEYGNGSAPRKVVHHDYDIASRLTGLTYDGQSFASNIVYNAASQTTFLNVGSGANQIEERNNYDSQTGLLGSQTIAKSATPTTYLLNLEYQYTNANGKRTGQLTKILNNLNHQKDRGYSYDALGRLVQATGGPSASVLWTQTYSYDRYGNRLTVSANGQSASNRGTSPTVKEGSVVAKRAVSEPRAVATGSTTQPNDPKVDLPTDLLARNNGVELPTSPRDDGKPVSDSPPTLRPPSIPSDPPTFTNNPLEAGVTTIQALHITELRTAINALRVRLGMSSLSWQQPTATGGVVQTGGIITADPIIEMRTALDQALGPPSPSYSAGLAQGQPILAVHIQELRDRVVAGWTASSQIPRDGHASLTYDVASNRITTFGFEYDKSGNQVRALIPGGTGSQRFQYDAANRLVKVKADDNQTVIATYTFGDSNARLMAEEGGLRTYYACNGSAEYIESGGATIPVWSKSYVYLGNRLLSTLTPNGAGGEAIEYHHPDRLGTRVITNPTTGGSFEQVTLPFGTALSAESTGATNRRFTSYDRSSTTGLDYAANRHYDSQQGRFTQVDPIGMRSVSLTSPQTLNLYAYCANDPINHMDPSGLGFFSFIKKAFNWIKKHWKIILVAVAVAVTILLIPGAPGLLSSFFQKVGVIVVGGGAAEGGGISTWLKVVLGGAIAAGIAGLGAYLQNKQAGGSGGREPLRGDRKKAYEREKRKARDALKNPDCQKFLSEHGINPNDVLKAIDKQRAFDGTTSTITAGAAGVVKPGSSSISTPLYIVFSNPNLLGVTAGYAQPGSGANPYDTYFGINRIEPTTIIFEALHSLTGLDDDQLASKFGLIIPKGSDAAEQVGIALANHNCK